MKRNKMPSNFLRLTGDCFTDDGYGTLIPVTDKSKFQIIKGRHSSTDAYPNTCKLGCSVQENNLRDNSSASNLTSDVTLHVSKRARAKAAYETYKEKAKIKLRELAKRWGYLKGEESEEAQKREELQCPELEKNHFETIEGGYNNMEEDNDDEEGKRGKQMTTVCLGSEEVLSSAMNDAELFGVDSDSADEDMLEMRIGRGANNVKKSREPTLNDSGKCFDVGEHADTKGKEHLANTRDSDEDMLDLRIK